MKEGTAPVYAGQAPAELKHKINEHIARKRRITIRLPKSRLGSPKGLAPTDPLSYQTYIQEVFVQLLLTSVKTSCSGAFMNDVRIYGDSLDSA